MNQSTVERIVTFEVTIPLPKPLQLGSIHIPNREYTVVFAYDSEGNVGSAHSLSRNAPVSTVIERTVAPYWLGTEVQDTHIAYDSAVRSNVCLGTNGIFWRALSLVDCAMWELRAKAAGLPLRRLICPRQESFQTVLVGGYPLEDETAESLSAQIAGLAAKSPGGIKIGGTQDLENDIGRLSTCRSVIPEHIPLMIDLYWQYERADDFREHADRLRELQLGWIEDAFPMDAYDEYQRLATEFRLPVAVGDEQTGLRNFEKHMEGSPVIRLDATVCGGVTSFIRIAERAHELGIVVSCHVYHHLHTQLAASLPAVKWVELIPDHLGIDSISTLWTADLDWKDGCLVPSDGPGTGVSWDFEQLNRYRKSSLRR